MTAAPASDWSHYEVMLPRPSHSIAGRRYDGRGGNIPVVRSFLRANAYERTVSHRDQYQRDRSLAVPQHLNSAPGQGDKRRRAQQERNRKAEADYRSSRQGFERSLPPLSKRSLPKPPPNPQRKSHLADAEEDEPGHKREEFDETRVHLPKEEVMIPFAGALHYPTYSETPIHERDSEAKVFDLPQFVRTERAIITHGRRFTWGGRLKLQMPTYDPLRAKALTASQF